MLSRTKVSRKSRHAKQSREPHVNSELSCASQALADSFQGRQRRSCRMTEDLSLQVFWDEVHGKARRALGSVAFGAGIGRAPWMGCSREKAATPRARDCVRNELQAGGQSSCFQTKRPGYTRLHPALQVLQHQRRAERTYRSGPHTRER